MKSRKVPRIVLTVVFVALLAAPVVFKRLAARREAANIVRDTAVALARYGFYLEEVGQSSRAGFTHQAPTRSEEHTSELQSQSNLVCRLLLEKKNKTKNIH